MWTPVGFAPRMQLPRAFLSSLSPWIGYGWYFSPGEGFLVGPQAAPLHPSRYWAASAELTGSTAAPSPAPTVGKGETTFHVQWILLQILLNHLCKNAVHERVWWRWAEYLLVWPSWIDQTNSSVLIPPICSIESLAFRCQSQTLFTRSSKKWLGRLDHMCERPPRRDAIT